ncbi:TnsA endonuclease N-terminal domain-containing protein [Hydrogenophaga sp.]|uniref:TnsA endonuclease N-terminal domain-containing protein n=1 Tax=Hydrogenophaga sp. TaxID=1904254 RepID=UPI002733CDCA|nr:TnsA endonuclease N-terminal domain-containing protein [Hydrogenophaga sp.]MDP3883661.1 TnsA endonuclease N-terminal domain-containing protein [Hydrogenophaga sp.]
MTRKVVTRTPHREVGIVNASWLLDHEIEHESHLEKRFIMIALSCPVVRDIVHQPFEIWLGPDKTQKYTPDFLITLADGSKVVIEVKPEVFLDENKARLDAAKIHLSGLGYPFLVVTDKHIDAHGLSSRALLLMRYGRLFISESETLECRRLLEEQFKGSASVKALVEQGASESAIWNLVATHQFRVPAGLSLSESETVYINHREEDCHAFICTWFGVA